MTVYCGGPLPPAGSEEEHWPAGDYTVTTVAAAALEIDQTRQQTAAQSVSQAGGGETLFAFSSSLFV